MILRTTTAPWTTTARSTALLSPMIATSGALMMGVDAMPPSLPRLVTVMVGCERGEVGLWGVGEVRDGALRLDDGFGNEAAQADDFDFGGVSRVSRVRRIGRRLARRAGLQVGSQNSAART